MLIVKNKNKTRMQTYSYPIVYVILQLTEIFQKFERKALGEILHLQLFMNKTSIHKLIEMYELL